MPNRIIKESIRASDSINELSWFEEVLFYRLIVSCDDYGRFDGRIAIIKGTCFPLKDVTTKDIEKALNKLVAVGLVGHYEVEEKPYLQLLAWERHQTIRAKKSKYPEPDVESMKESENMCKQMNADASRKKHVQVNAPVIQSNPNPIRESKSESYSGDARLDDALGEYKKMRKQIKKPMTDRAMELAIGKLQKMTTDVDEQIAIVNQSVMNSWQGLFPLKEESKKKETNVFDEWRNA
jgi:hypothetical protein